MRDVFQLASLLRSDGLLSYKEWCLVHRPSRLCRVLRRRPLLPIGCGAVHSATTPAGFITCHTPDSKVKNASYHGLYGTDIFVSWASKYLDMGFEHARGKYNRLQAKPTVFIPHLRSPPSTPPLPPHPPAPALCLARHCLGYDLGRMLSLRIYYYLHGDFWLIHLPLLDCCPNTLEGTSIP